MSKFVQKTLHSLNTVLNNSGIFYTEKDKLLNTRNLSVLFFQEKVKNVETKREEEEFVNNYLTRMEKRLSEPDVSCAEVEEIVKICIVCETLGYKCDFSYVHALKLAQKGNYQQKHTGYLAAEYFLHCNHELVILLINTIQKDLSSSNYLEVILALTVVCHLINNETVHNVLHLVEDKLHHPISSVRKSAVLTLMHCLQLADSESAYQMALPKLEKCLSDSELDVVSVVVPTLHKVLKKLSGDFTYLLDSLLQLLEQILMRRIPHSLNYSDIPAPWLQIEILKLLKYLCKISEHSEKLIPVLKKILAQSGSFSRYTISQAIVYQVIETIACIEADTELLEAAMSSISQLLKLRDVNMKFMGLEALVLIVKKIEPNITATQQDIIIDCLKLPDESLQLKTLELMYHLANAANVQAICKKMTEFLSQIKENQKKRHLAEKILQLAEKYKNRHQWYISVVHSVLSKVDHLLISTDICKIINVILQDKELKRIAKHDYIKYLEESGPVISSLVKIYVSILAEPAEFTAIFPLLERADDDSLSWILISLTESILKFKLLPMECANAVKKLETRCESSYSLQIILQQLLEVINNISDIPQLDTSIRVDPSLTHLDSYVLKSFDVSEDFYEPPSLRMSSLSDERSNCDFTNSIFSTVNTAETSSQNCSFTLKSPAYSTFSSPSISFQSLSSDVDLSSPTVKKKAVWTKEGRSKITPGNQTNEEIPKDAKDEELLQLFAGIT